MFIRAYLRASTSEQDASRAKSAMQLGVPVLTADREWKKVKVKGLKVEHIRWRLIRHAEPVATFTLIG
jgi:DNA invertase Pin-like site-specific DNA recombinase